MIYLDSCIVIYALEAGDETGDKVRAKLAQTEEAIARSSQVLHECLVRPLRLCQILLLLRLLIGTGCPALRWVR